VDLPKEPIALDRVPVLGASSTGVVMVEFSDFECPFCGKFANGVLPYLKEKYVDTGRVEIAFMHFPLSMHPRARPAAEAAACAAEFGKFWPMHDLLFRDSKRLSDDDIASYFSTIGISYSENNVCSEANLSRRVEEDERLAKSLVLRATPTFFIGRRQTDGRVKVSRVLTGAVASSEMAAALDAVLSEPSR
jgi:protein-disulfide isomerase